MFVIAAIAKLLLLLYSTCWIHHVLMRACLASPLYLARSLAGFSGARYLAEKISAGRQSRNRDTFNTDRKRVTFYMYITDKSRRRYTVYARVLLGELEVPPH